MEGAIFDDYALSASLALQIASALVNTHCLQLFYRQEIIYMIRKSFDGNKVKGNCLRNENNIFTNIKRKNRLAGKNSKVCKISNL